MINKKEKHRIWKKEWRLKNPEKEKINLKKSNAKFNHSKKGYESRRKARNKKRQFILDFFGGKCVKCGFSDPRALQMDHKNGRKGEKRLGNIDKRYRFVRDFPKEARKIYQMLCANCNFIKMEENGEYYYHDCKWKK
jgi:hypothetical protein